MKRQIIDWIQHTILLSQVLPPLQVFSYQRAAHARYIMSV